MDLEAFDDPHLRDLFYALLQEGTELARRHWPMVSGRGDEYEETVETLRASLLDLLAAWIDEKPIRFEIAWEEVMIRIREIKGDES
jgi:hypothetical protein